MTSTKNRPWRVWIGDENYENGHYESPVNEREFQYEKSHDDAWQKLIKLAELLNHEGVDAVKAVHDMDRRYYENSCERFNNATEIYKGTELDILLKMIDENGNPCLFNTEYKFNSLSMMESIATKYADGNDGLIIHVDLESIRKKASAVFKNRQEPRIQKRQDRIRAFA